MAWRVARSLDKLLAQVNGLAPNRDKSSDGSIGDAAHASRKSDHNPWITDSGQGVVTARDITHDPADGVDCNILAETLTASRDPRIKYIIWNRHILNSSAVTKTKAWTWRPYSGSNPHTHHMHLSVLPSKALYDSTSDWNIKVADKPSSNIAQPAVPAKPRLPMLKRGSTGDAVKKLQAELGLDQDGIFGPDTQAAVKTAQAKAGLVADGIVGPYTWEVLSS